MDGYENKIFTDITEINDSEIEIHGYLTQGKLTSAFLDYVCRKINHISFLFIEVSIPGSKRRYDFSYENRDIKQNVYVEFDGYRHYQEIETIKSDDIKDRLIQEIESVLVRFPYWVQLDTETLKYYFDLDFNITTRFPHGFIDKKALLPSSFSERGIDRFERELLGLPANVRNSVILSLKNKSIENGVEYVIPKRLRYLEGYF